jgi:O-antigen/teichoic acid export membrane protein
LACPGAGHIVYGVAVSEATTTHAPGSRRAGGVLARNVAVLTGSQVATWCASLAWSLVVPRVLGPAQIGIYTLGVAAGGVLTVVIGLGMQPLLVREIAADKDRAPALIGTSIVLRGLISLPVLAGVVIATRLGHIGAEEGAALTLGWGMCIFYLLAEPIQSAFQASDKMQYLAYAGVLTKTGVAVGGIALVLVGVRAIGLLITSIAVMAVVMALNFIWVRRLSSIDWRVTWARLRSLFLAALPYWSFAAFFTIYLWIDSLMLGIMTSSTVLGWYGLPTRLFGTLLFVPTILSTAWLPQMVRRAAAGGEGIWHSAHTSIELVLSISMPVCVGTALVAPALIRLLYGPAFAQSAPVMVILAFCLPPMYFGAMVNQVLIALKRQMDWTKVMALASIVNPIANLILIPYFQRRTGNGAIGAALSLLVTELLISGIGVALTRRAFSAGTFVRLGKALVATAGMALVVELTLRRAGLAAGILSGVVTLSVLAVALRVLSAEERDLLREALARITRRGKGARSTPG